MIKTTGKPSIGNPAPTISIETYREFCGIYINSFDDLVSSLPVLEGNRFPEITGNLHTLFERKKLYQFFVLGEIADTRETIFSNEDIRDFFLNLTQIVGVHASFLGREIFSALIDAIATQYSQYESIEKAGTSPESLTPVDTAATLAVSFEQVASLLQGNPWLLTVYLFLILYPNTATFKVVVVQ